MPSSGGTLRLVARVCIMEATALSAPTDQGREDAAVSLLIAVADELDRIFGRLPTPLDVLELATIQSFPKPPGLSLSAPGSTESDALVRALLQALSAEG